eukprot:541999-Prymnesium_polylepis.2
MIESRKSAPHAAARMYQTKTKADLSHVSDSLALSSPPPTSEKGVCWDVPQPPTAAPFVRLTNALTSSSEPLVIAPPSNALACAFAAMNLLKHSGMAHTSHPGQYDLIHSSLLRPRVSTYSFVAPS